MQQQRSGARRTSVVTGGTGGIGRAVAIQLAQRGHRVLIVGRDATRGATVLSKLNAANPDAGHALIQADLALMRDTIRVASEITERVDRLDAAVLCAGIFSTVPEWTDEGLERSLALNYLTRFLLIQRVLPLLERSSSGRIVLVANAGKYPDTLDLDDPQLRNGKRGIHVAGRTQFANDLLAVELAERVRDKGIAVTCVFPGLVATDVFRNARGLPRPVHALMTGVHRALAAAPEKAAQTPVFLADDPAAAGLGGGFYGPRRRPLRIPDRVLRPERRSGLWTASMELVRPWMTPSTNDVPT